MSRLLRPLTGIIAPFNRQRYKSEYKWPARFVVWPELPKSGYGKVTKRDVKQRLEETA